ncbi:hypothetical protein [Rhizobium leguminosarum]|uniref:hypothetical protein n=1 Tax=Rhizobium leguminosarum TaxID=384 RepID=UPI002E0E36C3|nr:hypothetical protein U8Q02_41715 [Rhizobium leguminosarum]
MKTISVAAPSIITGTAKDWAVPRAVRCLLELHVDVPEFTSSELEVAYKLPDPVGGKTLFRRGQSVFGSYDARSWEKYGYFNPGLAVRVQHAVLSFGLFGDTPMDRYSQDGTDRWDEIWPTSGRHFLHDHGFEPYVLSYFKMVEDVGFHDVPDEFIEARRRDLLSLVPELILVDGTLYGRHPEPAHYWSEADGRPVPLRRG